MAGGRADGLEVAGVYAASLLELAVEADAASAVMEELDDLISYMDRDAEFAAFLESPVVDSDDRRASLERLFRDRLSDLVLHTLLVLNDRGRSALLRYVHRRYRLLLEQRLGQVEVSVTSAEPLEPDLRRRLKAALDRQLGKDTILVEQVDPQIIGGLVIQRGDERYDASVARQLSRLREALQARASREMHSGKSYFEEVEI